MDIELLASILGAAVSLLAGGLFSTEVLRRLVRRFLKIPEAQKPYAERLKVLTESLTKASSEVDSVLAELAGVARAREGAVTRLESDLAALESREKELKTKIEALQKTPLPVAEHFAQLVEAGERRSTRRDYLLFGAGVVVTTAIALIIQLFVK